MKFSDLIAKLEAVPELFPVPSTDRDQCIALAQRHVINAHGKFYGLRSKYDGSGNLRKPMKA